MSEQAAMMSDAAKGPAVEMSTSTSMVPTSPTKPKFDLTLYLVTSSSLLPPNCTLESHIEAAIKGGVTIVQLREKNLDTAPFIALGKRIHSITKKYGVPLLINDRVDVALAVGCEGAHIGWDDMDYNTARNLLGPTAIIGLSVSNVTQASLAASTTADYIGIGPIFPTRTKPDASAPLYPSGLRQILGLISSKRPELPSVAIGSINATNLQAVLYKSRPTEGLPLAGVAVVSAIISSTDPESAASGLLSLYKSPPLWASPPPSQSTAFNHFYLPLILDKVVTILRTIKEHKPLVHHITNAVVKNFSANVTLAVGGSPIMSDNLEEVADLAAIAPHSACLVNMGTSGPGERRLYLQAIRENNKAGKPVVFDPVGAGATGMRKETVRWVLDECGYVDVIKGNEGEIRTIAGEGIRMKGVDSDSAGGIDDLIKVVKGVAGRERNVVVTTGATDVLSDGVRTVLVNNGHPFQALVTGMGCALGSVICAALAVNKDDKLMSCLAAVLLYNVAAERAVKKDGSRGPGSFSAAFLDELYEIGEICARGEGGWLDGVKVEFM
ncbi:hypothetical protein TWF569_006187 [Orbilia oligospora]|uniref:Thiamine phosphate synthase/TenI domain-containing protein n=1 Tax=Orbilia oligospora TaxID=2813651 RepID=A0A7C8NA62_ORBOL|nr:hypothetical protein TWF706_001820 [Orbilia oligospora]KAF3110594.1 hypothetical protein TWF102_008166 [Orbilia oligospora]KAF3114806.1 hypothetical protein TWF103_000535 [Orbilia oligospora]KAF3143422.1 hypothetical protein TWF703_010836 [Orbilia oligospora]KAF3147097.1 hypothetical protein TWF569_006187 [Orbilia oligospora]